MDENHEILHQFGSHFDGKGTHFRLYSENADKVEVCLFHGDKESRQSLARQENSWSTFLEGVQPGQLYGFRVYGPWHPQNGQLFNGSKLLLDPFAKQLSEKLVFHPSQLAYQDGNLTQANCLDSAKHLAKSVVTAPASTQRPFEPIPWSETVIYEAHVKGISFKNECLPYSERGTFKGLVHPIHVNYFQSLGITTLQLMPIMAFSSEPFLVKRGLTNYWGYNPVSFFAPDPSYGSPGDFLKLVRTYHQAGIEIILDVVYNHTAEGDEKGPNLSLRGIDNQTYYRLGSDGKYTNWTGCGNTLDFSKKPVQDLVLASLRYWAEVMEVDGFRFDLATVLGRDSESFSPKAKLFERIQNDPILSRKKMIAEPWDLGPKGYQRGNFPVPWFEWNDQSRKQLRGFWRGDSINLENCMLGQIEPKGRSIHYITSHDGKSLFDCVTYEKKYNEANLEENRDGNPHEISWNHGVEGPTQDFEIHSSRLQSMRNMIICQLFSDGVPMIRQGDERLHTQFGNNNAYCQDNEISWLAWESLAVKDSWRSFYQGALGFRKKWFGLQAKENRFSDESFTITRRNGDQVWFLVVNRNADEALITFPNIPPTWTWQCVLHTGNEYWQNPASFKQEFELEPRVCTIWMAQEPKQKIGQSLKRSSGILLHPSSLPSALGIGDVGSGSLAFLDQLAEMKQSYWQMLPIGPTGYGNSPYQSLSSFAGNPLLIDLSELVSLDLIQQSDLDPLHKLSQDVVDFESLVPIKMEILAQASQAFGTKHRRWPQFESFCFKQRDWLEDFALYCAIKENQDHLSWVDWDSELRDRKTKVLNPWKKAHQAEIFRHKLIQFFFFQQWKNLHSHAKKLGIQLIGDLPIFVAHDSADVWANPDEFLLDGSGNPTTVAGVPPDYFSELGQLWGNPHYDWQAMSDNDFHWWKKRLGHQLNMFDWIRLDHFRGFVASWHVPFGSEDARPGKWMMGPGERLFRELAKELGSLPIIAEDLGVITEDVIHLRKACQFPGMRILQFGFGEGEPIHRPDYYEKHMVAYSGTHDNQTLRGWLAELEGEMAEQVPAYLGRADSEWSAIRCLAQSRANFVIFPIQDILALDDKARMNQPGTTENNWQFRLKKDWLTKDKAKDLASLTQATSRI